MSLRGRRSRTSSGSTSTTTSKRRRWKRGRPRTSSVAVSSTRAPDIPAPVRNPHPPKIPFPAGACDCHAHIFGPKDRYPLLPQTHFVPHENPLADYVKMLRTLGCSRGVLVQPSVYGTDNTLILEALKARTFDLRAVAVVAEDIIDRELEALHEAGFRGIRINTASATPGLKLAQAPK